MRSAILCRYGELFLKSGNRRRFERTLAENVARAVRDLPGIGIDTPHGRIVAHADAGVVDEACARLERVFGLVSLSVATRVPHDIDAIGSGSGELRARRARRAGAAAQLQGREPALRQAVRDAVAGDLGGGRRARRRGDRSGASTCTARR